MPKGIMLVQSGPADPSREDEYNEWYSNTHIPEICAIPGFVTARRCKVHNPEQAEANDSTRPYVAIYEIEADDLSEPLKELRARAADGRMDTTNLVQMDPPPVVTLYELIE